jgi:hypothetical protein
LLAGGLTLIAIYVLLIRRSFRLAPVRMDE